MKRRIKGVWAAAVMCAGVLALGLTGCEEQNATPDFSNVRYVASLATLECSSHNVVRMAHEGSWLFNQGYRKMWYEYTGTVSIGIDVGKVKVTGPDEQGVVTIEIPPAQVISSDVDEESFTDPISESSWFFTEGFSAQDRAEVFSEVQDEMEKKAAADENLMSQARQRAKDLLEQYVRNAGDAIGATYQVEWKDVE